MDRFRWLPYVAPLVVYMLVGLAADRLASPPTGDEPAGLSAGSIQAGTRHGIVGYPLAMGVRVAATIGVLAFFWPVYRRFAFRLHWLAVVVGILGGVLWIVVCRWHLESTYLEPLGLSWFLDTGRRVAFNPIATLGNAPVALILFLGVRMVGLVLVVPLSEELFLRGFLVRFWTGAPNWWQLDFGAVGASAYLLTAAYGVLTHPAEAVAAAIWFPLITWLMLRTRNLWDCVVAHAMTNLLLGAYVLLAHQWSLW